MGVAGRIGADGHQVRLRYGAVWGLHGSCRRRCHPFDRITLIDSIGNPAITTIEAISTIGGLSQNPKGLAQSGGRTMRLLPIGPDHVCDGAARKQSPPDRLRDRRCDVRQHLPLWNVRTHSRSHQAGRCSDLRSAGRLTMTDHQSKNAETHRRAVARAVTCCRPVLAQVARLFLIFGPAAAGQKPPV